MAVLRLLTFWLVFGAGTLVAVLASFPLMLLGPAHIRRHAVGWARFHGWCVRHVLRISVRIEGDVPHEPALIAAKHQAMFETFDLIRICGPVAVVAKQELLGVPLWGLVAQRYGLIPVDREGSAAALRTMLRAARAAVAEGRGVVIFPEGTRVAPGEQPPLRPGFAGLYRQLGLPVVPVAIDSGRLWPRDRAVKQPGVVTFRFGEPIPPGLPRAEAEARVHRAINELETGNATASSNA